MTESKCDSVRDILLTRRGVAFVPPGVDTVPERLIRAIEVELADVGYVLRTRLRDRLACCSLLAVAEFRSWALGALLEHIGGDQKHEPLFRQFPDGVPDDTDDLWWKKVLVHFLQSHEQPCLFCGCSGTTHVLNPCRHVVCDRCFDGANYSACPVCEQHVDRSSPFFQPDGQRGQPKESVPFKLIDLAEDEEREARLFFANLCERTQALSPSDRQALIVIVREYQARVLERVPAKVPVRENVALVFGTLLQELDASAVLPHARRFLTTATDVLRLIAVMSYYHLKLTTAQNEIVAVSSGDLRGAPGPDGATEYVDLSCECAASMGARFAVMVINAYAGLPFSALERAFAGIMLRDDRLGSHFDPRTVKLKFALDGANGVFMPLVLDLRQNMLHWLDVQSRGRLEMNNVATSQSAIASVCPNLIEYFESGVRPSLHDLGMLHAAARCQRVTMRGLDLKRYIRRNDESPKQFYARLVAGVPDNGPLVPVADGAPILAFLYQGDVDLPEGSASYALFRECTRATMAASDLLS